MKKPKPYPPQNFIIKLHIYPFDMMVSVNQSDEQLKKTTSRYVFEPNELEQLMNLSPTTRGRAQMFEGGQSIIRLMRHDSSPESVGNMCHEVFHVTTFVMERIGMKFKMLKSDEAYAYLIGYLTKEIFERMKV